MDCLDAVWRSAVVHASHYALAKEISIHTVIIFVKRKIAQRLQIVDPDKLSWSFIV